MRLRRTDIRETADPRAGLVANRRCCRNKSRRRHTSTPASELTKIGKHNGGGAASDSPHDPTAAPSTSRPQQDQTARQTRAAQDCESHASGQRAKQRGAAITRMVDAAHGKDCQCRTEGAQNPTEDCGMSYMSEYDTPDTTASATLTEGNLTTDKKAIACEQ